MAFELESLDDVPPPRPQERGHRKPFWAERELPSPSTGVSSQGQPLLSPRRKATDRASRSI